MEQVKEGIKADPVLQVVHLTKTFRTGFLMRRHTILKRISFEVYPGEIYGLIGPNGAGKTTTFKAINSLIFPDEGEVRIFGEDHNHNRAKERVGFLPESPYFYEYLTAREFLSFYCHLFGLTGDEKNKKISFLLALVGLQQSGNVQLRKFSKGMLQRIGMAQALINNPDFLILDEPMSGLDPIGRREFRDIILDLKKQGKTILFSSHILSDAEMLCDRVGILVNGRIVQRGKISSLENNKINYYEISCVGVSRESIPDKYDLISWKGSQILFRVPDERSVETAVDIIKNEGGRLVSLVPQRKSLEDELIDELKQTEQNLPVSMKQ